MVFRRAVPFFQLRKELVHDAGATYSAEVVAIIHHGDVIDQIALRRVRARVLSKANVSVSFRLGRSTPAPLVSLMLPMPVLHFGGKPCFPDERA